MKKLLITFLLIFSSVIWSADLTKGFDAYYSGDFKTALIEFKPLAEQGNIDAQAMLGEMYWLGDGVPQDYKTAVKWFTLAAKQGDSISQNKLGQAYTDGLGVRTNYKTALKWYRLSAEKLDRYTQENIQDNSHNNIALAYQYGVGVEASNVLAHMWFSFPASRGDKDSANARDQVEKEMTPDEISTAKKLAKECKLLNYKCTDLEKQTNTEKSRKIKDSGVFFNHVASDVGELFDGKWMYLGNNSSGDNYYGEINTIKENDGSIYWWFLVDNMKPHQQGYISFRGYQEVDCGRNRSKTLQYVFYKEPMGVSEIGRMTPTDEWEYSTTDSMGYNMVRWVCSQV